MIVEGVFDSAFVDLLAESEQEVFDAFSVGERILFFSVFFCSNYNGNWFV